MKNKVGNRQERMKAEAAETSLINVWAATNSIPVDNSNIAIHTDEVHSIYSTLPCAHHHPGSP